MKKIIILFVIGFFAFTLNAQVKKESSFKKFNSHNKEFAKPELSNDGLAASPFINKASKGNSIFNPGKELIYYWSDVNWMYVYVKFYQYNVFGQQTEVVTKDTTNNIIYSKTLMSYTNGHLTEEISQMYDYQSGSLVNYYKYNYEYDQNGYRILTTYELWKDNAWVKDTSEWSNTKYIVTYNNDKYPTEIISQNWNYKTNSWVNQYRETYIYTQSGTGWSEGMMEYWENNAWQKDEKYKDVIWYSFNGIDGEDSYIKSGILQDWQEGEWVDSERYNATRNGEDYTEIIEEIFEGNWVPYEKNIFTSDGNGGGITLYQKYIDNNWVNDEQDSYLYDQQGNFTEYKSEIWDLDSTKWDVDYWYKHINTYNNDGALTEQIMQYWNEDDMLLKNQSKSIFSQFQKFNVGVSQFTINNSIISFYPNPVRTELNIISSQANKAQVEIFDILGKKIYSQAMDNLMLKINVSGLAEGLYILKYKVQNAAIVDKFIIKR
ncbi:MAG: T9SS type A sorting domain-containing protein [Bacteroidales bacterium]|nr:T9SS type A sorting domain-containing protein [Bacteroidales bacterium]